MTRRRETRRRQRSARRDRDATGSPRPAPTPSPARPVAGPRDISWTGLTGGITGVLALEQSAFSIAFVDSGDLSTLWAIPIAAAGAIYLPAVWASIRPMANRRKIIRSVLIVSLVLMVIGAILVGAALFLLLLIPTALLAHAGGFIYQRREPRK